MAGIVGEVPEGNVIDTSVKKEKSSRSDFFFKEEPSSSDTITTSVKKS